MVVGAGEAALALGDSFAWTKVEFASLRRFPAEGRSGRQEALSQAFRLHLPLGGVGMGGAAPVPASRHLTQGEELS